MKTKTKLCRIEEKKLWLKSISFDRTANNKKLLLNLTLKMNYIVPHYKLDAAEQKNHWDTEHYSRLCVCGWMSYSFLAYIVLDIYRYSLLCSKNTLPLYFVSEINKKKMLIWICYDLPIGETREKKMKECWTTTFCGKMRVCGSWLTQTFEKKIKCAHFKCCWKLGPLCIRLSSYAFSHFI